MIYNDTVLQNINAYIVPETINFCSYHIILKYPNLSEKLLGPLHRRQNRCSPTKYDSYDQAQECFLDIFVVNLILLFCH